jgi:hypothetical protein
MEAGKSKVLKTILRVQAETFRLHKRWQAALVLYNVHFSITKLYILA